MFVICRSSSCDHSEKTGICLLQYCVSIDLNYFEQHLNKTIRFRGHIYALNSVCLSVTQVRDSARVH